MTALTAPRPATDLRFQGLFPDWEGPRRQEVFFLEQLLEARRESRRPTNTGGWDEDVNIYLAGLLAAWAVRDPRHGVLPGADPLFFEPPRRLPSGLRAEYYRRQGDHRLLSLGLFDRGDLVRRRAVAYGLSWQETRTRDLAVGAWSYARAADLGARARGLASVWTKLARHFDDYVQVLEVLARRRLGLGARLSARDLQYLLAQP